MAKRRERSLRAVKTCFTEQVATKLIETLNILIANLALPGPEIKVTLANYFPGKVSIVSTVVRRMDSELNQYRNMQMIQSTIRQALEDLSIACPSKVHVDLGRVEQAINKLKMAIVLIQKQPKESYSYIPM